MRKNRRLEEGFARPCVSCYSFSTRKKKNKFFFFFFEKDRESYWTLYFLRCKLCLLMVCNQKRASMHIRSDFLAIDRETINCQLIKLIYTRGIKRNRNEKYSIRNERISITPDFISAWILGNCSIVTKYKETEWFVEKEFETKRSNINRIKLETKLCEVYADTWFPSSSPISNKKSEFYRTNATRKRKEKKKWRNFNFERSLELWKAFGEIGIGNVRKERVKR